MAPAATLPARRPAAIGFAIAALALLPYLNTLPGDFAHDDDAAIREHPVVVGAAPWRRVFELDFWGHDARRGPSIGTWRPLTTATFALDWRLGGGSPRTFHRTNVALHVLASVGLVLLLLRGPFAPRAAGVAAALFATHPVHTEAVTSIVGRADVLGFCFALAVVALQPRAGAAARALQAAVLACACLAKESSVVVWPLLLAGDALTARWRPRWRRHVAMAASVALVLALRWSALGRLVGFDPDRLGNPVAYAPWAAREVTALGLFGHAASLLLAPRTLRADYGAAVVVPSTAPSLDHAIAAAALLGLALLCARLRRSQPEVVVAALAFVVPTALACNAVVSLPVSFAERLLYLPSAPALLLVALALDAALRSRPTAAMAVAAAPVVLGFAALTWLRNPDWRTTSALTLATVRDEPRSARFQFNRAVMLIAERRHAEALARCALVSALAPGWSTGWGCQAVLLDRMGRAAEAAGAFRRMRALPDVASCQYWSAYAGFLARSGRPGEALAELDAMRGTAADDARAGRLRLLLRGAPRSSRAR